MKSLSCLALAFCATTILLPEIASAQHRGSLQIQGPDLTQNYQNGQGTLSSSWTVATPITKKEARQRLATIENQLTQKQKDIRREALDKAIRFINQCPDKGCSGRISESWPGSKYRVDIEIFEGSAFTGTAPQ